MHILQQIEVMVGWDFPELDRANGGFDVSIKRITVVNLLINAS